MVKCSSERYLAGIKSCALPNTKALGQLTECAREAVNDGLSRCSRMNTIEVFGKPQLCRRCVEKGTVGRGTL
jgi:hypothetical protein